MQGYQDFIRPLARDIHTAALKFDLEEEDTL
jgi:hypothetical protein